MGTRMQQRRGTAFEWSTDNPVLADGEIGWVKDTLDVKVGDGVTPWNSLPSALVGPANEAKQDVVDHAAAANPHPNYLTPAEGDLAYLGKTAKAASAVQADFLGGQAIGSFVQKGPIGAQTMAHGLVIADGGLVTNFLRVNRHVDPSQNNWGNAHAVIEDSVGAADNDNLRVAFHLGGQRADQIGISRADGLRTYDNPGTGFGNWHVNQSFARAGGVARRHLVAQTGSYTGDGTLRWIWTPGFIPRFVWIVGNNLYTFLSSPVPGGIGMRFYNQGYNGMAADDSIRPGISSDQEGFVIEAQGYGDRTNSSGVAFNWLAIG